MNRQRTHSKWLMLNIVGLPNVQKFLSLTVALRKNADMTAVY